VAGPVVSAQVMRREGVHSAYARWACGPARPGARRGGDRAVENEALGAAKKNACRPQGETRESPTKPTDSPVSRRVLGRDFAAPVELTGHSYT